MISADISDQVLADFSCSNHLEAGRPFPPMLIARGGKDKEFINQTIDAFVAAAVAAGVDIDYLNHAEGQHAFDVRDNDSRSRGIIQRTLDFLDSALLGERERSRSREPASGPR
jgi:dienelactone hydrolase